MVASGKIKIYTRTGDKGDTSLISGKRVLKCSVRIEAYGTVDELNSVTGMLRDQRECGKFNDDLSVIQDRLFIIQSLLSAENAEDMEKLPHLSDEDVAFLEKQIDLMNEGLPEISNFIIPGGQQAVSWTHIARTVCRRAERIIVRLDAEESVETRIISYVNRLSDYFFVLARRLSFDLGVSETPWQGCK
jgi:cob(I)alamin adenosyltransferase